MLGVCLDVGFSKSVDGILIAHQEGFQESFRKALTVFRKEGLTRLDFRFHNCLGIGRERRCRSDGCAYKAVSFSSGI